MPAKFLNEIHDFQILSIFCLVRGQISFLRNVLAAGSFPFLVKVVGSYGPHRSSKSKKCGAIRGHSQIMSATKGGWWFGKYGHWLKKGGKGVLQTLRGEGESAKC